MIEIMPATEEMLTAYYGHPVGKTVRAIAAVEGDKVVGVAGFYQDVNRVVVFVGIRDELRKHPKKIVLGSRLLLKELRKKGVPVHAARDADLETSERFLSHFDFKRVSGELFAWQPPQ